MSEPEESLAAPDSTTREQRLGFSHGDDVLLQHKDGKFYLGTVVEVHFYDILREPPHFLHLSLSYCCILPSIRT